MLNLIPRTCERLLDAADLLIDFLTLGEYGLEPARPAAATRTEVAGAEAPRRLAA